jgi:hypothetical protein
MPPALSLIVILPSIHHDFTLLPQWIFFYHLGVGREGRVRHVRVLLGRA